MELSEERFEEIKNDVKTHLLGHEKRYIHILGVVEMAEYLANLYGVNPIKAKIAAVLHDYSKYDTNIEVLSESDQEDCKNNPYLLHAYLSEYNAKKIFNIEDMDILLAIRNHVIGRVGMSRLEEIIFISDFTEKNRVYDDCIKCRDILLKKGIDEAIIYSYESTMKHVDNPNPLQLKVLNYYKEKIKNA